MPIGNLTAFLTYIMQILISVMMAVMMVILIPRAMASAERIEECWTRRRRSATHRAPSPRPASRAWSSSVASRSAIRAASILSCAT